MMIEIYIAQHIAKYLLKHHFPNRKIMAQTLGIPYRSLLRIFNEQSYPGDVQRTMNAIATYCILLRFCIEKYVEPKLVLYVVQLNGHEFFPGGSHHDQDDD